MPSELKSFMFGLYTSCSAAALVAGSSSYYLYNKSLEEGLPLDKLVEYRNGSYFSVVIAGLSLLSLVLGVYLSKKTDIGDAVSLEEGVRYLTDNPEPNKKIVNKSIRRKMRNYYLNQ